jgi:hypothetical protein
MATTRTVTVGEPKFGIGGDLGGSEGLLRAS